MRLISFFAASVILALCLFQCTKRRADLEGFYRLSTDEWDERIYLYGNFSYKHTIDKPGFAKFHFGKYKVTSIGGVDKIDFYNWESYWSPFKVDSNFVHGPMELSTDFSQDIIYLDDSQDLNFIRHSQSN